MSFSEKFHLESVENLLKQEFHIPFVQRGYRWKDTQVSELLEDLLRFRVSPDMPFYFLQVLSISSNNKVIDGQQRLTTLSVLLKSLGEQGFSIKYDRAPDGRGALDDYFRDNAQKLIGNQLQSFPKDEKERLLRNVLGAKFLIHTIPEKEETQTFERLNNGKIAVSDSELIKCVLLTPQGDEPMSQTLSRASEWDMMERTFQNDEFYSFMTPRGTWREEDRMTILLRLAGINPSTKEKQENNHPFLAAFQNQLKQNSREALWQKICSTFAELKACFEDTLWHGALGWGMHSTLVKLQRDARCPIRAEIRKKVEDIIVRFEAATKNENLYEENPDIAKKILFLFNVAICWKRGDRRYPFIRHRMVETWSLEHIFAKNQRELASEKEFNDFCQGKINDGTFEQYRSAEDKTAYLKGILGEQYPGDNEVHGLKNLALLGKNENSGLLNWLFMEKEAKIGEMILEQSGFVPPATELVFHKAYPGMHRRVHYFDDNDMKVYVQYMEKTLKSFFTALKNDGGND